MEHVDISKWKRSPSIIRNSLKLVGDDIFVTNKKLYISFPARFVDKHLTTLGNTTKMLTVCTISDDSGNYGVMSIPSRIEVSPSEIMDVEMDGELFHMLIIEKGDTLFNNNSIIKDNDLIYAIYELFMLQGKIPWYLGYNEVFKLFSSIPKYTTSSIGADPALFEVLTAIVARNPDKLDEEFRVNLKTSKDLTNKKPSWIGLKNIYYSYKSTGSKLIGNYFKQAEIAAIVNPSVKGTELENILR